MHLDSFEHLLALIVNGSRDFFVEIVLVCKKYGDLVRPIDFKHPVTIAVQDS
jgi:hypothetical protein